MKALVTIRVGWLEIWYGCQGEPSGCPVWRALRRASHTYLRVRPHNVRSELTNECFFLPPRVRGFITRFDRFPAPRLFRPLFFWPFKFEIELPL